MDLIYANKNFEDIGVLQDYSFDQCYGISENNFECKLQKYNVAITGEDGIEPISEDSLLYMEFTEYGGIVDRIGHNIKNGEITLSGRTWHGIINSYVIEPPKGNIYRTYDGEINDVIEEIISDIGLSDLFLVDVVPQEDRNDTTSFSVHDITVRYQKAYDFIIELLDNYQGKLVMYYFNGHIHLGAVLACNYATNEEFDSEQTVFKAGKTFNPVNHLICVSGDDANKKNVIHLFVGEDGQTKPFLYTANPVQDTDYVLDKSQQEYFGIDEVTEIFEKDTTDVVTNYLPVSDLTGGKRPSDWYGQYYSKYYYRDVDEDGNDTYKLFKQYFRDEYNMLEGKAPSDWDTDCTKYYYWNAEKDPGWYRWDEKELAWAKCNEGDQGAVYKTGGFDNVKKLKESEVVKEYQIINTVADWEHTYMNYYIPVGVPEPPDYRQQYEQVRATQEAYYGAPRGNEIVEDAKLLQEPVDWSDRFSTYYTWEELDIHQKRKYIAVQGVPNYDKPVPQKNKKKPKNWNTNWNQYYVKVTKTNASSHSSKIKISSSYYITAADAVNHKPNPLVKTTKVSGSNIAKYEPNVYYVIDRLPDKAPKFSGIAKGVFVKYSRTVIPQWRTNYYYEDVTSYAPTWYVGTEGNLTGYYTKIEHVEQFPTFDPNNAYYAVKDHYKMLVSEGLEKLKKLRDTSTLSIDIEPEITFDVLDIIGIKDEVTAIEELNMKISQKIVKIKKDIITVEYEVSEGSDGNEGDKVVESEEPEEESEET